MAELSAVCPLLRQGKGTMVRLQPPGPNHTLKLLSSLINMIAIYQTKGLAQWLSGK